MIRGFVYVEPDEKGQYWMSKHGWGRPTGTEYFVDACRIAAENHPHHVIMLTV